MAGLKLVQLQNESDAWKRQLVFITEETINLKSRISEVLKETDDNEILDSLENFQTSLIKEDELILLLRDDVREYDKLLTKEKFEDGWLERRCLNKTNELRRSIFLAAEKFESLKSAFYSYLTENIA